MRDSIQMKNKAIKDVILWSLIQGKWFVLHVDSILYMERQ